MVIHESYTHKMHTTWRELETYLFGELNLDRSQYENYRSRFKYIEKYFSSIPFTRDTIVEYKLQLLKQYSPSTVCLYLDLIRHICKRRNLSYMNGIMMPKKPRVLKNILSKEEEKQVLILAYSLNYRYAVAIEMALRYGYRINTIRNLKWSDVHSDYIIIRNQKDNIDKPKPIDKTMLFKINQIRKWNHGYVFGGHNGLISPKLLNIFLRDMLQRLNITKHLSFHDLRHTFATLMHDEGVSIRFIQELLDHKQITTTELYTHVSIDSQRKQLKKHPLAIESLTEKDIRERFEELNQWLSDANQSSMYYEGASEFILKVTKEDKQLQTS